VSAAAGVKPFKAFSRRGSAFKVKSLLDSAVNTVFFGQQTNHALKVRYRVFFSHPLNDFFTMRLEIAS
jgi:hypothetical protein